jgi:CHAT domain-containing protein/Tfp pilus assembly protein PilF
MTRMTIVRNTSILGALSVALLAGDARDAGTVLRSMGRITAPIGQELGTLTPDQAIERRLARGEEHRYQLALTSGEYASVIVEQRGIDVLVQVRGADEAVADVDDEPRSRGQEHVEVVADVGVTFTVAIKPAPGITAPGFYTIRIASRRVAADADRSTQQSRRLRTTATRLETEGRFDEARRLLEHALTITEAARGSDDVQVAAIAAQLAGVYRKLPDSAKSELFYRRAITIMARTLGHEHPTTALARSQLALLYQRDGDRLKAEALLRQALEVIEKTLGAEHPWFVSCLATLGNLHDNAGDLDKEEEVVRRALAIMEKIDDTNSVQYAALLNNLGEVYRQKQDYARAEELFQRSLVLSERLLGPDNYSVATALQNLGIIARERRDYATAMAYNTRALLIRERTVGPAHPDVAHILTNLGNIFRATGDTPRSLETHLRALNIWETAAGPYQQATLLSVGNIAKTYAAAGDLANAIAYQQRADTILEKELALNLVVGSEKQKLTFVRSVSERTDRTISLHLRQASGDSDASALAALVVLQRKGRVLDAMIDTFATVRRRIADTIDQGLLDQLNATTAELARVALKAPAAARPELRQNAIRALEARKDRLEAELAEHSAAFRAQMQPVTLEAVQAAMPDDTALLEFAVFRPFDPKAERNADAYGPPHYAAYVVRKHAAPLGLDLGMADAIDGVIDAFRQALRDPRRTDLKARARAVDELVLRPLRASLGTATRLLISPDGELNLVPFEAFVDEHDRYLIEHYAISYLTSGRDLLRMQAPRASLSKPVVFANPGFGEPATRVEQRIHPLASTQAARDNATTGDDLSALYFAPLAATEGEARAIKTLFPDAALFTGRRATKATLQRVEAPRMLHIASHGFFLEDPRVNAQNPLLRSGLALAGANLTGNAHDDGILTALEAAGLDLWGTKLVTLSACDTGIGEVRNGEGVYGLRRAFVLAGAETVVMSLWPVSDYFTRQMMVAYYTGLRAGLGRSDALRQAKLAILKRKSRQHPFYWASFIQSGEWASLDGNR